MRKINNMIDFILYVKNKGKISSESVGEEMP